MPPWPHLLHQAEELNTVLVHLNNMHFTLCTYTTLLEMIQDTMAVSGGSGQRWNRAPVLPSAVSRSPATSSGQT